jgi:hypothetical protein
LSTLWKNTQIELPGCKFVMLPVRVDTCFISPLGGESIEMLDRALDAVEALGLGDALDGHRCPINPPVTPTIAAPMVATMVAKPWSTVRLGFPAALGCGCAGGVVVIAHCPRRNDSGHISIPVDLKWCSTFNHETSPASASPQAGSQLAHVPSIGRTRPTVSSRDRRFAGVASDPEDRVTTQTQSGARGHRCQSRMPALRRLPFSLPGHRTRPTCEGRRLEFSRSRDRSRRPAGPVALTVARSR